MNLRLSPPAEAALMNHSFRGESQRTMSLLRTSVQYAKRSLAVVRGQEIWRSAQIRCARLYLGNERARWCVCPTNLSADSVVYSFGIGEDISFDLQLIDQFGVKVHAFDPTPRSLAWLRYQTYPEAFVVHEFGVSDYDGVCSFFPPENPLHVSHSAVETRSGAPIEAQVLRLATIMEALGHSVIHLLKMDIEGAEYAVLSDLLKSGIRVDQLLVEFHHRWPSVGAEKTRVAIRELNLAGYYIFNVSPSGEEYSFRSNVRGLPNTPCSSTA
jgi:FkbM family methyltransferase